MRFQISFFVFLLTLSVSAQEKFASQSLKKIFDELPLDCKKNLIATKECDCLIRGSVFHLESEFDGKEMVHLGLRVFNNSIKNSNNSYIYSFIERELLKFILDDNQTREARRKDERVYLYYANNFQKRNLLNNSDLIRNVISEMAGISIKQDSSKYKVLLVNPNAERLEMEFPKVNSLIRGMDKKELDEMAYLELSKTSQSFAKQTSKHSKESFSKEGDLLVSEGEHYQIKNFSSKTYYKKEKDSIQIAFDQKYIKESFSNLFLTGSSNYHQISLDLKIKSYGNNDKLISTSVDQFLAHFDSQFKLFFGIEDFNNNHLRGTLIIYNPTLNYIHLLDLKTNSLSLFGNPGVIAGTLYPFIPTDNIKDLIGKENEKQKSSIMLDDILKGSKYE